MLFNESIFSVASWFSGRWAVWRSVPSHYTPQPPTTTFKDILPSTTAVFSYVIGSRKLSANEQFFVGAQTVISLLQTTQIKQGVSFIAANKVYASTNKTTIVWIESELLFFTRGGCISCLRGCLGAGLLPQSYQYPNLSEGADRVGGQLRGDKECPFSGVTKSGRVWRKVPESDTSESVYSPVKFTAASVVSGRDGGWEGGGGGRVSWSPWLSRRSGGLAATPATLLLTHDHCYCYYYYYYAASVSVWWCHDVCAAVSVCVCVCVCVSYVLPVPRSAAPHRPGLATT